MVQTAAQLQRRFDGGAGAFAYLLQGALTASLWDRMVWAGLSMAFLAVLWPKERRREACDGIDPAHSQTMHEELDREEAAAAQRAERAATAASGTSF